ncbi:MAG: HepT-like ribonuclease domain-containing protein [Caldilineaceae bacterium]
MSAIPEADAIRLRHMLDAAAKARMFAQYRDREDLEADEILALALVRLLEILGEAAAHVSPEVQAQFPAIPWRQMTGTRNRLIHALEAIVPPLADT